MHKRQNQLLYKITMHKRQKKAMTNLIQKIVKKSENNCGCNDSCKENCKCKELLEKTYTVPEFIDLVEKIAENGSTPKSKIWP